MYQDIENRKERGRKERVFEEEREREKERFEGEIIIHHFNIQQRSIRKMQKSVKVKYYQC